MSGKDMGSEATLITVDEAAQICSVHVSQVHAWNRAGLIDAHYPKGRRGGKHFRRDDVLEFLELKELEKTGLRRKLPQVALRALASSRRAERRLSELLYYLGLDQEPLDLEREAVVMLFVKAQSFLEQPAVQDPQVVLYWAKTLLAITEEYLDLVALHLEEPEPWDVYMRLGKELAARCSPESGVRKYVDHARRNLRNVAYFYLCGVKGHREAGKRFPGETFSGRLMQRLFPD